jgi:hypothetical protein
MSNPVDIAIAKPPIDFILENPPPFHQRLLDYGERPYWTMDGTAIAFIDHSYGDACEIDLATRTVRQLTKGLGPFHSFLRVLVLSNGDYLLVGPREFKSRNISREVESELWVLDRNLKTPPKPLGRRIFEGAAVSYLTPRISYAVSGKNDPSLGHPNRYVCYTADIVYDADGPRLANETPFYQAFAPEHWHQPEPQDFRYNDSQVILSEYRHDRCVVKGVDLASGNVQIFIDEPNVHNECEGIFPDHEHICLEAGCDGSFPPLDLFKLKLDGSGQRVRMTGMAARPPWRATNSNVSPDGKWLAFMVNVKGDETGFGRGLGLLDLEAWGRSEAGRDWKTPGGSCSLPSANSKR